MIIGHIDCSWNTEAVLLGQERLGKGRQSLYFTPDAGQIEVAPVISGPLRIEKAYALWSTDHVTLQMRLGKLTMKRLVYAMQDESEVFRVRNRMIYGHWTFTITGSGSSRQLNVIPCRSSKSYTKCEPYREALAQWFVENVGGLVSHSDW